MPAYGASRPLRRLPAMVSFLSRKPALSLDGRNRSSCPEAAARNGGRGELGRRLSAMFATSPSRRLRSQCRGRCFVDRPSLIARLRASPCRQARRWGSDSRRREKMSASIQPKLRVQYLSAVRLAVPPPAGHAEPYLTLLSRTYWKDPASRLPEHPEDVGVNSASRYGRAACGLRAVVSSTRMIEGGR